MGGEVTRSIVIFQCDVAFAVWLLRVCEVMALNPQDAALGYKYDNQRVGDHPTQISSEADLRIAIDTGRAMTARAYTRTVCIMVYNLVTIFCPPRYPSELISNYSSGPLCKLQLQRLEGSDVPPMLMMTRHESMPHHNSAL